MAAVKIVFLIALMLGAILALQVGKKWMTTSPYFEVAAIEVSGNNHIPADEVRNLISVIKGQNIFTLNMGSLRRAALSHPWVKEATVKRALPRTVRMEVEERKAFAMLEGNPNVLLDEEGVVLEATGEVLPVGLPHISGDSAETVTPGRVAAGEKTLKALEMIKVVSALPFIPQGELMKVDTANTGSETIFLRSYNPPITVGTDSISDKLKRLYSIKDYLEGQNGTPIRIDLTFQNKVIAQYPEKSDTRRQ